MPDKKLTRFEEVFDDILNRIICAGARGSAPDIENRPIGLGMAIIALSLHDLADAIRENKSEERSKEDG